MTDQRRILLVTSWGGSCGIAEHSRLLREAVQAADPDLQVHPSAEALDPAWLWQSYDLRRGGASGIDLVCLNHHDGLHSRWEAHHVQHLRAQGIPVVVVYHDTRERLADCPKLESFILSASAVVIHEPMGIEGNHLHYWRQGVPAPARSPANYAQGASLWPTLTGDWVDGAGHLHMHREHPFLAFPQQPVLGTVGFNFPWKNYDRLAAETREAGWALVLLSNNATEEDETRWKQLNPSTLVVRGFLDGPTITNYLAGCDATAFMYQNANTGTSGAVLQGVAARKPVLVLAGCRQMRALDLDPLGHDAICWVQGWEDFPRGLRTTLPVRIDPYVHALAEQDSWARLGGKYADLYRQVLAEARS